MENYFRISIPDKKAQEAKTLGDLVDIVEEYRERN
jgi:acyl carrier protein